MKRIHDKNPKEHANTLPAKLTVKSPPNRSAITQNDTKFGRYLMHTLPLTIVLETTGSTDLKKIDLQNKSLKGRFMIYEYQDEIMKEVDRKFKEYEDKFHIYEQEKKALQENTKKMREELDRLKVAGNFLSRSALEQEREEDGRSDTTTIELSAKQIANLIKELNAVKEQKAEDLKKYRAELNSLKEQIKLITSTKNEENEMMRAEIENLKSQLDLNRKQAERNVRSLKMELKEERQNATAESQKKDRIIASEQAKTGSYKKIIDNLSLKLKEKQKSPDTERSGKKESTSKEVLKNRAKMSKESPVKRNLGRSLSPRDDRFQDIKVTESAVKTVGLKKSDRGREKASRASNKTKTAPRSLSLPKDVAANEQNVHDTPQERVLKKNILSREKNIQFLWDFVKQLRKRLAKNIKNQQELESAYRERVADYESTIRLLKSQLDSLIFQISNKDKSLINPKPYNSDRINIVETQAKSKNSSTKYREMGKRGTMQAEKFADEYILPKVDPGVIMYHGDSHCSESDQDLLNLISKGESSMIETQRYLNN